MLIRIPKPWELPEGAVTPEEVYRSRRRFLRTALAGAGAGLVGWPLGAAAASEALARLEAPRNAAYRVEGRPITPESITAGYNNFYEFLPVKEGVAERAAGFKTQPWKIKVRGQVEKGFDFDAGDLLKRFPLEERVYRMRCVEAWSIVVPWVGFPLAKFVEWCKPTSKAKFLRMVSFYRPSDAIGQRQQSWYPWPYFEGLRMDEATNEVAMLVVGSYGKVLPVQNGSPVRLITPWKYGYKSIKSITVFEFTDKQPPTFWNTLAPDEYGFLSNVNPAVPHPRWSQATEEDLTTRQRIPTLPYNGYGQRVAQLYK